MIALLLGTLLAVGTLAYVLAPLFREEGARAPGDATSRRTSEEDRSAGDGAIEVLREIEFDRATGKLSDDDYAELKATYTRRAVEAMRAGGQGVAAPAGGGGAADGDEIEARIRSLRATVPACVECGPRPEPDAVYCSTCGRFLAGACGRCGAPVTEPGARYCTACGGSIGAMTRERSAVA